MFRRVLAVATALVLAASLGIAGTPTSADAATAPLSWLKTNGNKIQYVSSGKTFTIRATSWFGMETETCAPHGLWSISLDQGMAQIAGMGFNTVRVPFSNECLAKKSVGSVNLALNPKLAGASTLTVMDAVVKTARKYKLRVILDRHRPGSDAQSALWYTARYSESKWISDWKALAKRYKNEPTVFGFDLHNEPSGTACWGCGVRSRDWRAAAMRAGDAIHTVNPKLLMIVEGVQYGADGSNSWWGGNLTGVKKKPVTLKVKNRVVYSPHEYPASVFNQTWFSAKNYPSNLTSVWHKQWGYISRDNIAPVFVGEFGTKLQSASDKAWMKKLVAYLKHRRMSWGYWSFNPNSGDTGGLLKDDWYTREKTKLAALKPILTPKKVPYPAAPSAQPQPSQPPKPQPSQPSQPPAVGGTSSASSNGVSATLTVTSAWQGQYQVGLSVSPPPSGKVRSWTASWASPGASAIDNAWGMSCSVTGAGSSSARVTCRGTEWGLENLNNGARVDVGVILSAPQPPAKPKLSLAVTR